MATKWQKFIVPIPAGYSAAERRAIAGDIIDAVVAAAQAGKGLDQQKPGIASDRKAFPKYSDAYIKSLNFKIAGKNKNDVNLTLSGDMLGSIKMLPDSTKTKLVIGFEKDSLENAKADGNIRGTYGKDRANYKLARNFLGLTEKELTKILADYPLDDESKTQDAIQRAAEKATSPDVTTTDDEESD